MEEKRCEVVRATNRRHLNGGVSLSSRDENKIEASQHGKEIPPPLPAFVVSPSLGFCGVRDGQGGSTQLARSKSWLFSPMLALQPRSPNIYTYLSQRCRYTPFSAMCALFIRYHYHESSCFVQQKHLHGTALQRWNPNCWPCGGLLASRITNVGVHLRTAHAHYLGLLPVSLTSIRSSVSAGGRFYSCHNYLFSMSIQRLRSMAAGSPKPTCISFSFWET